MREIKFRAWQDNKMMEVRSLHNIHSQINIQAELCDPDGGFGTAKRAVTDSVIVDNLMQYTGLKDKNGLEIYEGDIVAKTYTQSGYEKVRVAMSARVVVEWKMTAQRCGYNIAKTDNFLVIGNIYKNPELLK